jgi:general secretion pathway protein G
MLGALLAVLSIVSLLLVMAGRSRQPAVETARVGKARNEVEVLNTALDLFYSDCGRFPSRTEGLVALVRDPGVSNWGGPYVNLVKPDPWHTRYIYRTDGDSARASSAGPDRIPGTADDVSPPAGPPEPAPDAGADD